MRLGQTIFGFDDRNVHTSDDIGVLSTSNRKPPLRSYFRLLVATMWRLQLPDGRLIRPETAPGTVPGFLLPGEERKATRNGEGHRGLGKPASECSRRPRKRCLRVLQPDSSLAHRNRETRLTRLLPVRISLRKGGIALFRRKTHAFSRIALCRDNLRNARPPPTPCSVDRLVRASSPPGPEGSDLDSSIQRHRSFNRLR